VDVQDPAGYVEIAGRIQSALTALGYAWESKDGSTVEVQFSAIQVAETEAAGTVLLLVVDTIRLPRRVSIPDLTNAKTIQHLAAVVGHRVRVLPGQGLTYAVMLSNEPRQRLPARALLSDAGEPPPGAYVVPIGLGERGPVWRTLPDLDCILVAGQRGMGKSTLVNLSLAWLLSHNDASRLRVALVDPKEVELALRAGAPHNLGPVARDTAEADRLLGQVLGEMDGRRSLFARAGVRSLAAYNSRADRPLPLVLVVADEVADLALEAGAKAGALATLARLVAKGRAFGIHAVLSTQRPDAEAVSGILKANVASRFAFWLPDSANYRIALNPGRGQQLPSIPRVPGRCVARLADGYHVLQSFYLEDAELERLAADVAAGHQVILDPGPLGPAEVDLVRWAIKENDGGLGIENIQNGLGLSSWQARRLAEAWQARGWLEKRGPATLPRQITGSLVELLERLEDGEQFADV
jgi:energy-coupling factor transporter ATP-binding protein EcfA2